MARDPDGRIETLQSRRAAAFSTARESLADNDDWFRSRARTPRNRGDYTRVGLRRGPRDPYTVGKGAPRIIQRATRAHAQSTPARKKHTDPLTPFSIGDTAEGRRDRSGTKKDRVADRATAPPLRAPALDRHHAVARPPHHCLSWRLWHCSPSGLTLNPGCLSSKLSRTPPPSARYGPRLGRRPPPNGTGPPPRGTTPLKRYRPRHPPPQPHPETPPPPRFRTPPTPPAPPPPPSSGPRLVGLGAAGGGCGHVVPLRVRWRRPRQHASRRLDLPAMRRQRVRL